VTAIRYSGVAIALHWLIAAAIVAQLAVGLWMVRAMQQLDSRMAAFQAYQWHKSLGLTILVLSLARLGWRLAHPPPALPDTVTRFERIAARSVHWLLYALTIAIPLIGWAMVSASPLQIPTLIFGWFQWPHLPWFSASVEPALKSAHRWAAYLMIGLLVLHIAAALKHHFVNRDGVLRRMLPFR
jgi:cytochrome b561